MGYIDLFWSAFAAAAEDVLTFGSKLMVSAKDIPATRLFDANSFFLKENWEMAKKLLFLVLLLTYVCT